MKRRGLLAALLGAVGVLKGQTIGAECNLSNDWCGSYPQGPLDHQTIDSVDPIQGGGTIVYSHPIGTMNAGCIQPAGHILLELSDATSYNACSEYPKTNGLVVEYDGQTLELSAEELFHAIQALKAIAHRERMERP